MKIAHCAGALLLVLISAVSVSADFYRFVDKNGNVIYTDDINKVPVEQRNQVQSYDEAASRAEPANPAEITPTADDEEARVRERLQAQEEELNREYEDLMAERQRLEEEKGKALSSDQIIEYNEKIVEFNTRIQAYEEKRGALETEVEAFNERLEARQKEIEKKP